MGSLFYLTIISSHILSTHLLYSRNLLSWPQQAWWSSGRQQQTILCGQNNDPVQGDISPDSPVCLCCVCVTLQGISPSVCHSDTQVPSEGRNVHKMSSKHTGWIHVFSAYLPVSQNELLFLRSVVSYPAVTCSETIHHFPAILVIPKVFSIFHPFV